LFSCQVAKAKEGLTTRTSHKIGSIRASVQNEWAGRIRIPLKKIVKYGNVIVGDVAKVVDEEKKIVFSDKSMPDVHYDILVAATGATSRSPGDLPHNVGTPEEIAEYFKDISKAIEESSDIVIVGGGASSIEYAGEIRARFPEKHIKIVSASANLLTSSVAPFSPKFMTLIKDTLKKQRIELILEERVVSPSAKDFDKVKYQRNATVKTKGKRSTEIKTDLVIWAASFTVDVGIYPDSWQNELGELEVRDTFQLRYLNDVFAFGDVTSIAETKQAITLPAKLSLVASNILVVAEAIRNNQFPVRQEPNPPQVASKVKHYRVATKPTFYLPVGPKDGASQTAGGLFGPKVYGGPKTSDFKGKDLYCDYFWKLLTEESAAPKLGEEAN